MLHRNSEFWQELYIYIVLNIAFMLFLGIHLLLLSHPQAHLESIKGTSVGGSLNHIKSDSESGFDEVSSQLSRSGGVDELTGVGGGGGGMLRSPSSDQLTVEQLIAELKTVAIGWKSFRNVFSCSCASPFDHYVKKVRLA